MRILVNYLPALKQRSGVGHYTAELCAALQSLHHPLELDLFPHPSWEPLIKGAMAKLKPSKPSGAVKSQQQNNSAASIIKNQIKSLARNGLDYLFADRVRRIGCDLYHEPNFLPFDVDAPTISTIHDLSVIRYPQWHPKDRVHEFEKRFEKALSNCTHFLTDLEFVKQELVSEFNVPSEKITATPLGIRSGLSPLPIPEARAILKELNLPQKYFLHLGTIEPRKNLLFFMQVYCDLPLRVREQYPLLLVGGWGWNAEKEAAFYEETAKHHNVILSGYIPDDKISAVYNCARALLAPSHYEGFGLPPVEMMACGGAVLASKIGAHQEVCGTTTSYFHPEDKDAWRDALLQIAWDDEWHRALRKGAVEKAARFSWHQCALNTYSAYEKVLGINATPALIPSSFKKAC